MEPFMHLYPCLIKELQNRLNKTNKSLKEVSNAMFSLSKSFEELQVLSEKYYDMG